jgi:Raf kinase inhibitor-like YbhB/YbcL family protein
MSYNPYALAFPAAPFLLSSKDFEAGGPLPTSAYQPSSESPELSWGPLPTGTRSLVVTAFDADAPIPGGLWHWAVKDIPVTVGGLAHSAAGVGLALANDLGQPGYTGVNPPPGTGTHRLFIAVTALSIDTLEHAKDASLAKLNIAMIPHTLGRAILIGTSTPAS